MTEHIRPRRVATVSFSTLLLCLTGAGTALAASGTPSDASLASLVPTTGWTDTSILPSPGPTLDTSLLPSPTPVPTALTTVTSTLQGLTGTTSSPAPAPTASPLPGGVSGAGGAGGASTGGGTHAGTLAGSRPRSIQASGRSSGSHGGTATLAGGPPQVGSLEAGAARVADLNAFPGQVPAVAPQLAQLMAAGQAPALAPRPQSAFGGWGGQDPNVPRGLLVALATLVVGGLAAGHVKLAQRRLVQLGAAPPRYRPSHRAG